jgi:hypothetical protein
MLLHLRMIGLIPPLTTVRAELLVEVIPTKGSSPLRVLANDGHEYIAKTTEANSCVEVINEVLCGYLARCWDLPVPPFSLVHISPSVVGAYEKQRGRLPDRYRTCPFGDRLFFGSRVVSRQVEVDAFFGGPHHPAQMQLFHKPLDLVKIGVFDQWVGNFDRKPDNPNVLLGSRPDGTLDFCPIDHTAAFGYLDDYRQVRDVLLTREPKKWLLSHRFVPAIVKFTPPSAISDLHQDLQNGIDVALSAIDSVFAQVPVEWGLSRKAKEHLKQFFADSVRNERIVGTYLNYLL